MSSSYVPAETESPNFYFQSVFILRTFYGTFLTIHRTLPGPTFHSSYRCESSR